MDNIVIDAPEPLDSNIDTRLPNYMADGIWQPARTGNYKADCSHGYELAGDIVERMRREENPLYLSIAMRAMVESGRWEAVEIGLVSRFALLLS